MLLLILFEFLIRDCFNPSLPYLLIMNNIIISDQKMERGRKKTTSLHSPGRFPHDELQIPQIQEGHAGDKDGSTRGYPGCKSPHSLFVYALFVYRKLQNVYLHFKTFLYHNNKLLVKVHCYNLKLIVL